MKDMLGQELAPGDYVAYGSRRGNTGRLAIYRADKVGENFLQGPSMYYDYPFKPYDRTNKSTVCNEAQALRLDIVPQFVKDFLAEEET